MLCRRVACWVLSGLPTPPPVLVVQQQSRSMNALSTLSAWNGLDGWRVAPIDERRSWGTKNAPVVERELQPPSHGAAAFDLSAAVANGTPRTATVAGEIGPQLPARETEGVGDSASWVHLGIGDLASWGRLVLVTADPLLKAWLTHQAYCLWRNGELDVGVATAPDTPGRPPKPELLTVEECMNQMTFAGLLSLEEKRSRGTAAVGTRQLHSRTSTVLLQSILELLQKVPPRQVPSPKDCKMPPSAHMLHTLAHIELNAIDLAWDTVVRFSHASEELGRQFFSDFLHVADDESRHFRWCSQRLSELGYNYGDMPAHNMLWQDCLKTSGDVKSRLAVIPMMQEARGLDAGPRLVKKLLSLDDHRSAAVVRRIGQEEVAHVGVGVFHFLRICEEIGVNPGDEFKDLLEKLEIELHGPFNHKAREVAGLPREWYDKSDPTTELPEAEQKPRRQGWKGRDRKRKDKEMDPSVSSELLKPQLEDIRIPVEQSSLTNSGDFMSNSSKSGVLPEVYERLALLVAMEKENAGI